MEAEKRIPTSSAAAAKSQITINNLDDDSLAIIFNKLLYRDRVGIESVFKRWRDVSKANWGTYSKHLIIDDDINIFPSLHNDNPEKNKNILEKVLKRRGRYLEEITIFHCVDGVWQRFEVGTIKRIVECCPKLKRLTTAFQNLNEDDWIACTNLEALSTLGDTSLFNGLNELLRRNKRLRQLKVIADWKFLARDFDHLDPGQLEILLIKNCPKFVFTAELTNKLAESLIALNYANFPGVTGGLRHLSKLQNLRSLILNIKCRQFKTQFIVDIARNCQKLERITLYAFVIDAYNLNFIPLLFNLPCLKSLVLILNKYEMPYEELDTLFRKASNLKFFVLSSCAKCKYEDNNINPCDRHLNNLSIHTNKIVSHSNEAVIMTAAQDIRMTIDGRIKNDVFRRGDKERYISANDEKRRISMRIEVTWASCHYKI